MKHLPLMTITILILVVIVAVFVMFDHSYIVNADGTSSGQKIKRGFFSAPVAGTKV